LTDFVICAILYAGLGTFFSPYVKFIENRRAYNETIETALFLTTIAFVMLLSLAPVAHAATYTYAVDGGNLKFDPTTGTIIDCDHNVYSANIPSEIFGVPVKAIGKSAFSSCSKLVSVTIPSTVETIGQFAFKECSQLVSIEIPEGITWETGASSIFSGCRRLETVTLPGSVKQLPKYMFSGCSSLKTVVLGEGIEELNSRCFTSTEALEEITLPNSLRTVASESFYFCSSIKSVILGSSVKSIDKKAFFGCRNLESMYFTGNAPATTDEFIYSPWTGVPHANGFTIYYPKGASGWTSPTWNGYITKSYSLTSFPALPTR